MTSAYKVNANTVTSDGTNDRFVTVKDFTENGRSYRGRRGLAVAFESLEGVNIYNLYMSPDEMEELGYAMLFFAKKGRGELPNG